MARSNGAFGAHGFGARLPGTYQRRLTGSLFSPKVADDRAHVSQREGRDVPWQLEIHTIDIGRGDSSLIVIDNPGVPNAFRSILIDGGLSAAAETVHNKVTQILPAGAGPDVILVSHYDTDHSFGITSLLFADNLDVLAEEVAGLAIGLAITAQPPGSVAGGNQVAARVACAVNGILFGSYGDGFDNAIDATAMVQGTAGGPSLAGPVTLQRAAEIGCDEATAHIMAFQGNFDQPLVQNQNTRERVAIKAGKRAGRLWMAGQPAATIRNGILNRVWTYLSGNVDANARFHTDGIYQDSLIIDIGNLAPKDKYIPAAEGRIDNMAPGLFVEGVNHQRTGNPPALGRELFWGAAGPPVPNAPYAVVLSGPWPGPGGSGQAWQGTPPTPGRAAVSYNGDINNVPSIALVIKFNNFVFFTAGDMPFQGEDELHPALTGFPLPNGAGGALAAPPPPPPMAGFKLSHHGGNTSTNAAFLAALQPAAAYISAGNLYGHPAQNVITRLYANAFPAATFLTNCRYSRLGVAGSAQAGGARLPQALGFDQHVAGNRAWVAGDNVALNFALGRNRGDIRLRVLEAASMLGPAAPGRFFQTQFWDQYPAGAAAPGMTAMNTNW